MNARHLFLLVAIGSVACSGTEVGKVDFHAAGTQTQHTTIHEGHVDVWVHLDVAFDNEAAAYYHVKLVGSRATYEQDCMPFDPAVQNFTVKTTIGNHESLRYVGKMRCSFDVPADTYDAEATLFVKEPTTLQIKHMNLVFKQ